MIRTFFKRACAAVTALAVVTGAVVFDVPNGSIAAADETDNCSGNHAGLAPWNTADSLPTSGKYYLDCDVTLTAETTLSGELTLCLNGHTVAQSAAKKGIIKITNGSTFTLSDCGTVGKLTGVRSDESGAWDNSPVFIGGGTFNMYGGSISGNETKAGGGVFMESGTFNLYGGGISDNTVYDYGENNYSYGGGVYLRGGTFNMSGGSVSNNRATRTTMTDYSNSTCGDGGGVYVAGSDCVLNLSGGKIEGNTGECRGGGIYLVRGAVNMTGGSITGNKTQLISGKGGGNGGGVFAGSSTVFTMSNGTISDNRAIDGYGGGIYLNYGDLIMTGGTISGNMADNGGGIEVCGKFTMSGGTISGNTAKNGGGIYHYSNDAAALAGKVNISGNKTPDGTDSNLYIANSSKRIFTIEDGFDTDNPIGISVLKPAQDCANPVDVTNEVGEEIFAKFTSEQSGESGCSLVYAESVIRFEKPHDYPDEYSNDEVSHWYECRVCSAKKDETDHDWKTEIIRSATCVEAGEKKLTCQACNFETTEIINATGHSLVKTEAKAATCTADGNIEYRTCSLCGKIFADDSCTEEITDTVVPSTGHTEEIIPAVPAGCTEDGKTEGVICSVCGEILTPQDTIARTGHSWDSGEVTTEPAEESEGVKTFHCVNCTEIKTEIIPPLNHAHELSYHERVEPDCETEGNVEYWSCSKCGNNYGDEAASELLASVIIGAAGHIYAADEAVEPTCINEGLTEGRHCERCGTVFVRQETVEALGHDWKESEVTKQPSCSEKGVKILSCTRCDETQNEEIPMTEHTLETVEAVAATCEDDGLSEGKRCVVCGEVLVEQEIIPASGHSFGDWQSNDINHWKVCGNCAEIGDKDVHKWDGGTVTKEPDKDNEGEMLFICTVCEKTKTEVLPANGEGSDKPENPDNSDNGNVDKDVQPGENAPETKLETPLDELIEAVLTPEEREEAENGTDIKIILTVDDGTELVSDEDKERVEEAIDEITDCKLGQYLDINLLKIIGDNQKKVTETNAPITVMFELPEALRGDGREYSVIRVHEGASAVLEDLDNDKNTVTIKTDRFSTYALVYSEKSEPSESRPPVIGDYGFIVPDEGTPIDSGAPEALPSVSETTVGAPVTLPNGEDPIGSTAAALPDDVPIGSENASQEINGTPSESGESLSDGYPSDGKGVTDSGAEDNPATGIAVSFVPLTAALAVLTAALKRKRK